MSDEATIAYASDAEIEVLVARFESCELPPAEVSHRVHIAMSAWCFLKLPERQAAARIYEGLQRYVNWHKIDIYNETITWFWIKQIAQAVASLEAGRPAFALVNDVMARFGDSRLIFTYYTRERLQTAEARRQWIEPDLQPLNV
jgi:hypothetical protein